MGWYSSRRSVVRERGAEVGRQRVPVLDVVAERVVEALHPSAAGALRRVQGGVGLAQQVHRRDRGSRRRDGDADGRRHVHVGAVDVERLGEGLQALARAITACARCVVGVLAEDGELVAAEAGDGLLGGDGLAQAGADADQQLVTPPCPRESLTILKWSRSTSRTAVELLARARAWVSRSTSRVRFGSRVRPSCRAAARSSSSARRTCGDVRDRPPGALVGAVLRAQRRRRHPQPALVPVGVGIRDLVPLGTPSGRGSEPVADLGGRLRCSATSGRSRRSVPAAHRGWRPGACSRTGSSPTRSRPRSLPPSVSAMARNMSSDARRPR